jgi:hypothetical protein
MNANTMIIAGLVIVLCTGVATPQESPPNLAAAWSAWRKGDIEKAEAIAAKHAETDEGRHLLTVCACVQGKYAKADEYYRAIDRSYKKLGQLDEAMLHALLHLHRYDDAVKFAKDRALDKVVQADAAARARKALAVTLAKSTEVPFADHMLTPYFPAFAAQVNGAKTVVHLDTGGTWLAMGTDRTKKLGIELEEAGEGFLGARKVKLLRGVARTFTLGDAVLENVPVVAMPALTGPQDFVIFGTNVLQQFHATVDYPNKKLLLCPRGNKELAKKQMEAHKTKRVEVPFYMWGDHYMFVRGGFGKHKDLNFFVDSGLVALDSSKGLPHQACFTATPEHYKKWGVKDDEATREFFECELPLSLGPLVQTYQYFTTTPRTIAENVGGLRIDGLIGHAFLKEYVWTLDFDRMCYAFSNPR